MHQLWQHPNGTYYVLYGPRLKRRVSTRSRERGAAEGFLAQFIAGAEEPRQSRRLSDDKRKNAAGHGIERTCVTNAPFAKQAVDGNQNNAVPLFGAFLGALVLAVGSLVLWLELIIRDATIYIALNLIADIAYILVNPRLRDTL